LSLLHVQQNQFDGKLLLWEPVTNLYKYWNELLNIAFSNQLITYGIVKYSKEDIVSEVEEKGKSTIDGYGIGRNLFRELAESKNRTSLLTEDTNGNITTFLWRNKKLFQELSSCSKNVHFFSQVKLAWDNIRFIDNYPEELLSRTGEFLAEYGKISV
jgi:hypothetical protein